MLEDSSKIPSLSKCKFTYGPGMQKQWVESNHCFLTCITAKYDQSVKMSLVAGEVVVTEVDEDLIPKFETKAEEDTYLAGLKHWQVKQYHATLEDYTKFSRIIWKDLATVQGVLFGLCNVSLQNRIEAEPEYQLMVKRNRFCTMKLHDLVKKVMNGSTAVVVEDVIGNMIEAMFNFMLIRAEEYEALPKYLQAFEHRFEVLTSAGFNLADEKLRDMHMNELQSCGQGGTEVHKALVGWKSADAKDVEDIKAGKDALTNVIKARMCLKRSGKEHEECRREMSNNYIGKSREYSQDVAEANRQLEYYRPMCFTKKKSEERGEQHFGDAGGVKGNNPCFRCGRVKPDCAGARNCKCDKKADGTDVNSQDVIDGLFKSQKEAKRNRRKETTGS